MKLGLCLSGGGAKGSYQAGVIKALYDRGINKFYSISGTSIGAINGYYLYTNNVEKLENMWINILKTPNNAVKVVDNTVDNSDIIEALSQLENNKISDTNFYVNYINIKDKQIKEIITNLSKVNKEDSLKYIKYSSLLPYYSDNNLSFMNFFIKSVDSGMFNNANLDGGLANNTLIKPLIEDNVDKIIIISTEYDFTLPKNLDNNYNINNIIIVKPKIPFDKNDTLKFEPEFCKDRYFEGYEIGKNLEI